MSVLSTLVCIMVAVITQMVVTLVAVYHSGQEIIVRLVSYCMILKQINLSLASRVTLVVPCYQLFDISEN